MPSSPSHDDAAPSPRGARPVLRMLRTRPEDVVDVFVYVVVLNLAIEYLPAVISEGFTLSLLTAVLLKLALEVVINVKKRAMARFRGAMTLWARITAGLLLWGVVLGSKLVVLWLIDLVFGDAVSLGGFVSVTLLVVSLLLARAAVRGLLAGGQDKNGSSAHKDPAPTLE